MRITKHPIILVHFIPGDIRKIRHKNTDKHFAQSRFSSKYNEKFMGMEIQVSSPEDTILAKLRWAKLSGGSERQFTDALRVYKMRHDKLDMTYLEIWAKTGWKTL